MSVDHVTRIRELLESFDTAMLVTHGVDSLHHARPMAIARVEPTCDLWFFTGRRSAKVDEIRQDQEVLIVCQNERDCYVALRGQAKLVSDRAKAAELWKERYQVWFPKGAADPDLLLIQVKARDAEYWEREGFKSIQYLFEAAKAFARGAQLQNGEGEQHGTVSFNE